MGPKESTKTLLRATAWGKTLDVGTGHGESFLLLEQHGESVVGIENDPVWHIPAPNVMLVSEITPDILRGYDFAFVDHFPLEDRLRVAEWLVFFGTEVVVDDAQTLGDYDTHIWHRHEDALHHSQRGCPHART